MPETEIIDASTFATLLDSLGGDVDLLGQLVEAYFESSPELFDAMQQAIEAGQAPSLQRAAHSLKSGSASFGALAFAAQCKELEDLGKRGDLLAADEKSRRLADAYPQVVAALQNCLHSAR